MLNAIPGIKSLKWPVIILAMLEMFSTYAWAVVPKFESLHTFARHLSPDSALVHDEANNFYGITSQGGALGFGTISKIDQSGQHSVLYTFDGVHGKVIPTLLLGNGGKLYGWTENTNPLGSASNAVIFQLDINQSQPIFSVLYNNLEPEGLGEIVLGNKGKLYGTRRGGVDNVAVTIFEIDPSQATPQYREIYTLPTAISGEKSISNIIQAGDNLFYGLTQGLAGRIWDTEIFALDTSNATPAFSILKTVSSIAGGTADITYIHLSLSAQGTLYAVENNFRTFVFDDTSPEPHDVNTVTLNKLDSNGATPSFTTLVSLKDHTVGQTIQSNDGKLYLATQQAMFVIDTSVSPHVANQIFAATNDDLTTTVDPTKTSQGKDGMFYTTGQANNNNALIKIDTSSSKPTYSVLYSFNSATEGTLPLGQLLQASGGKIIGTTYDYGTNGNGALFQLDTTAAVPSITALRPFNGADFSYPNQLIRDSIGNIYGTVRSVRGVGGPGNVFAMIFQLDLSGSVPSYSLLHSFNEDGYANSFFLGRDNNFYGTFGGFSNTSGTVFRLNPGTNPASFSALHTFTNLSDRYQGTIGLGVDGNIYETAGKFKIDLATNPPLYSVLNEINPTLDFTKGSNGKFYGISHSANGDKIIQVDASSATPTLTELHSFPVILGRVVNPKLVEGSPGKFYGTVKSSFSETDYGYIFELDTAGNVPTFNIIHQFNLIDGTSPETLIKATDGHLYGVTSRGGSAGGKGTVFRVRLDPPPPPPANTAPIAKNDSFALAIPKQRNSFTVAAPGVLKNDTDADKNKLSVAGATATKPRIIQLGKKIGSVKLYADGHFVYTMSPRCVFRGTSTFTYRATDSNLVSNPATVTLTIRRNCNK